MAKKAGKRISAPTDPNDIWNKNPEVVRSFLDKIPDYQQLCTEVAYILEKKLKAEAIEIAMVVWRAKTLKSFLEKIERKKYGQPFEEITDFAGVRVVALYVSDIPRIEEIIGREFTVVEKVDKLNDKGSDKFGYGAIHFIVKLGQSSSGARYDDLKELICEIQVRTVLQDAWAIIDHHLVYKNESDVPTLLQRKLNRLAGLFEMADDQFDSVRSERAAYLNEIRESKASPHQFLENELNQDSFVEYLKWKFPNLESESYENQAAQILFFVDKDKYRHLSDLDTAVERAQPVMPKVIKELRKENLRFINYAALQVLLALILVDDEVRRSEPFLNETIRGIIEENVLK